MVVACTSKRITASKYLEDSGFRYGGVNIDIVHVTIMLCIYMHIDSFHSDPFMPVLSLLAFLVFVLFELSGLSLCTWIASPFGAYY